MPVELISPPPPPPEKGRRRRGLVGKTADGEGETNGKRKESNSLPTKRPLAAYYTYCVAFRTFLRALKLPHFELPLHVFLSKNTPSPVENAAVRVVVPANTIHNTRVRSRVYCCRGPKTGAEWLGRQVGDRRPDRFNVIGPIYTPGQCKDLRKIF